MRLIDADALLKKLANNSWDIDEWELPHEQVSTGLMANALDRETVEEMPTVDAVPVRYGKWIDRAENDDHYVYCSECGDEYIENDLRLNSWVKKYFKYCPNCGARMIV